MEFGLKCAFAVLANLRGINHLIIIVIINALTRMQNGVSRHIVSAKMVVLATLSILRLVAY